MPMDIGTMENGKVDFVPPAQHICRGSIYRTRNGADESDPYRIRIFIAIPHALLHRAPRRKYISGYFQSNVMLTLKRVQGFQHPVGQASSLSVKAFSQGQPRGLSYQMLSRDPETSSG
jgi:hypothetical protein